jgi:hypothetical protein
MQMRRLILLAILFATPSAWAAAQAGRFDVASVRAGGTPGSFPGVSVMPGGRISAPNVTLRELIRNAYSLDDDRILGGPDWIAGAPPGVRPPPPWVDSLPRALALANTEARCPTMFFPGWMAGRAITMAQLAARLKPYAGRPVIDRTNLAGEFAFELRYGPELPPILNGARVPSTSDGESLFTAVREQLGLALKAARAPLDVIVIDGAQRPTEN